MCVRELWGADYHSLHVRVCAHLHHMRGLIRKESENDCFTFIVLSLMKMWNVSTATISTLTEPTKQRLFNVSLRASVRVCERVLNFDSKVVLCHLNYMRKWIWIFIRQLYCIRYRTSSHMTSKTLKNRFLLSFEKTCIRVTHEFIRIHIHIHKQNVHSLHLKFTNWTKYNIHLMKRILISAW